MARSKIQIGGDVTIALTLCPHASKGPPADAPKINENGQGIGEDYQQMTSYERSYDGSQPSPYPRCDSQQYEYAPARDRSVRGW
jgi:hypothetical protein